MTITPDKLAQLRSDTPACAKVLHFNNAGASLMPDPVYEATTRHLNLEREIGGYEAEAKAGPILDHFYSAFAQLLNVRPTEIAYVENATRAWDMAFYALPLKPGDQIITHASEYASNYLAFLQMAQRRGVEIVCAPSDGTGQVDIDGLERCINSKTKLIAITHVPTQGGLINPAAEVGSVARKHGLLYLLDACQSVGQIAVDVAKIGCHILSGTGRKFLRGPRGTGFLYVSDRIIDQLDPPFIDLHSATWTSESEFELAAGARRFENWESYVAGRVGLAAAVDYTLDIGLDAIEVRVSSLASRLRDQLSTVDGVTVRDLGARKSGIVTFDKTDEPADQIAGRLAQKGINISVSTQAYARLDLGARHLPALARASVHYFNDEGEIERFCKAVADG